MIRITSEELQRKLRFKKKFAWIALDRGLIYDKLVVYHHVKPKYEYIMYSGYYGKNVWVKCLYIGMHFFNWNAREFYIVESEAEIEPFIKEFETIEERKRCLRNL